MSRLLKQLKYVSCPTCSAGIQSENFTGRTHCNGQPFENIVFQCGCQIDWIPNFERDETTRLCPKSAAVVAREVRRTKIATAIWDAVTNISLTPDEREKIRRFIQYELV